MSEMIQSGFDYAVLPTDSADQLRAWKIEIAAFTDTVESSLVQIGLRFQKAQDELSRQGVKGEGFAAWVKAETTYSLSSAYKLINVATEFKDKPLVTFTRGVLYAICAPNLPQEIKDKAFEKGESTTLADVKDWKTEFELERQARLDTERMKDAFREESNDRRKKIRELETQIDLLKAQPAPEPEVIEKEVIPADYESAKRQAAELTAQTETLQKQLETLQKQQAKLVNDQVKSKLQGYQDELNKLEADKKAIEDIVARKKAYLDSLSGEVKRIETHQEVINGARLELVGLAAFLNDMEPMNDPATVRKWLALADMHEEAMKAIRMVFGQAANSDGHELRLAA